MLTIEQKIEHVRDMMFSKHRNYESVVDDKGAEITVKNADTGELVVVRCGESGQEVFEGLCELAGRLGVDVSPIVGCG